MARINLLPWRAERRKQRQREFYTMLGLAAAAGVVLSLLLWFYYGQQISGQNERNGYLETEIAKVKEQNKEIDRLDQQKERLLARKKVIEELQGKRSQMVHLFDSLVRTIPDGVVLTALKQEGDTLTLEGRTQSNARVSAYMRNLESSGWMSNPELSIIQASAGDKSAAGPVSDIKALPLRTGTGALVDLAAIADVEVALSAAEIDRIDRSRQISVQANTAPGVALSVAVTKVENLLASNPPPPGLSIRTEGTARRLAETGEAIVFAFALAIVALYIVLASQFNSFGQPIIIMLTAPLSFSGAYFLMWAGGQEMSLFAQIGMIALMGIVMKNGILLVDLANQYRDAGMDPASAMRKAAPERLRPVLMTALAAIFGMLPVALAQSQYEKTSPNLSGSASAPP